MRSSLTGGFLSNNTRSEPLVQGLPARFTTGFHWTNVSRSSLSQGPRSGPSIVVLTSSPGLLLPDPERSRVQLTVSSELLRGAAVYCGSKHWVLWEPGSCGEVLLTLTAKSDLELHSCSEIKIRNLLGPVWAGPTCAFCCQL